MNPGDRISLYATAHRVGKLREKAESAFVQAFSNAKWPTHYLALTSLSGPTRALFLTGYESFDAWERDNQALEKNTGLSTAIDRALVADGELLSSADQGALVYREDYSMRAPVDIPHMRCFEISVFHVRPGRDKEWRDAVKLVKAAYEKIPDAHWAMYEAAYGQAGGTFLIFNPMKSASEIDHNFAQGKQFEDVMGGEGMKKLGELSAASIESSETNLFAFSPKMSYVPEEWVKADPEFWKPKGASAVAHIGKKPGEKSPARK